MKSKRLLFLVVRDLQQCQGKTAQNAIAKLATIFDVICRAQNIDALLEKAGVKKVGIDTDALKLN